MESGSVLVSPPLIGRNGDKVVATIKIQKVGLFSNETIILQTNLTRNYRLFSGEDAEPNMFLINGFANGELNGHPFLAQKVESNFVRLARDDEGKLYFGGTFAFGALRVKIPLIEAEEAKSSQDARLRFGSFDGDRVPKDWDLEELVEGALKTFTDGPVIPTIRVQEARILAWRIGEDSRPVRIQDCVLWIRLNNPAQWMLVHVGRNRIRQGWSWSGWFRKWAEYAKPSWIESYNYPPTNADIELFLNTNRWWTAPEGFTLLDAEVCAYAWKMATGQQQAKAF